MSRKHKLVFIALSLLPFAIAFGFRAVDNYQFSLQQLKMRKERPGYYPSHRTKETPENLLLCHEKLQEGGSENQKME